jgi:hypothetical protein
MSRVYACLDSQALSLKCTRAHAEICAHPFSSASQSSGVRACVCVCVCMFNFHHFVCIHACMCVCVFVCGVGKPCCTWGVWTLHPAQRSITCSEAARYSSLCA